MSLKHALRLVKQGRAEWVGEGRIRLSAKHRLVLERLANGRPYVEGGGYDEVSRHMTEQEQRNLPLIKPPSRPTRR